MLPGQEQHGGSPEEARVPTPRQSPRHPTEPPRLAVYSTGDDAPSLEEQQAALALEGSANGEAATVPTETDAEVSAQIKPGTEAEDNSSRPESPASLSEEEEEEDAFPVELHLKPLPPQLPPPMDNVQDYLDLESLLLPLRARHVRLVKPSFIIKWLEENSKRPFPHRQGLEKLAQEEGADDPFLDIEELCTRHATMALPDLQILSVSACWLSAEHPDPNAYHVATLATLLRCFSKGGVEMLKLLDYNLDDLREAGLERWGAGDGRPVGVFWDWASIYQESTAMPRTPKQLELVKAAMVNYDIWFAHKRTAVWMFNYLPETPGLPGGATMDPGLREPVEAASLELDQPREAPQQLSPMDYGSGGWTTFQRYLALFLSVPQDILDINDAVRENILTSTGEEPEAFTIGEDGLFVETALHKCWAASAACERGNYTQVCLNTMLRDRSMPLAPEEFNALIDRRRFQPSANVEGDIKPLYAKAFNAIIGGSPSIRYNLIGFRDRHVRPFLKVLVGHCRMLRHLDLGQNKISIPLEEWAKALVVLPQLEKLNLACNEELGGNVRALAPLASLRELRLNNCFLVDGDVAGLATLINLRVLNLSGTYVDGDVAGLATLTKLRALYLNRTAIEGEVRGLSTLSKLEFLYLGDTNVTGDVDGLSPKATPLHKLEGLWLVGAKVEGDRMSLLSGLQELRESMEDDEEEDEVAHEMIAVQQPENRRGRRRRSIFDGINPNAKPGKLNLTQFGV